MSGLDLPFVERDINGTTYRATTLTLDNWADLTECLSDLLGDPMASMLRGDSVMSGSLRRGDIEALVGGLIGKISKTKILDISKHMGKGLRAGDHLLTSQAQNDWWPHHMKDLAPVAALFLEAQYTDFFEGLADSLPQVTPTEDNPSAKDKD